MKAKDDARLLQVILIIHMNKRQGLFFWIQFLFFFFYFFFIHTTISIMLFKSVQRVSSKTVRLTKRFTSYQTGSEGATASSGSFGQKEKAIENQWARSHVS